MSEEAMAFPGMEYDTTAGQRYHYGLTKRELFAMAAMQGLCASEEWAANATEDGKYARPLADAAVAMADALLSALENDSE